MAGYDHTERDRAKRRTAYANSWRRVLAEAEAGTPWAVEAVNRCGTGSGIAHTESRSIGLTGRELTTPSLGVVECHETPGPVSSLFSLTPPKRNGKPFRSCGSELEFAKQIKARFNDAFGAKIEAPVTDAQARAIYRFKRKYGETAARLAPWVQRMTKTVNGSDWKASLTNLYSLAVIPPKEHPYWEWLEMRHETHREQNPQVLELMKKYGDVEIYRERFPRREGA